MKEIFEKFKNQNQKLLNKVDDIKNDINNEKRGIYNVTFNNKNATPIKTDLEIIEDAIIAEIAMYVRGYHNPHNGVRFRAVVAEIGGGTNLPSHTNSNEQIITFYSDRNLKQYKGYDRMKFQNPQVENYYTNQTTQKRRKQ